MGIVAILKGAVNINDRFSIIDKQIKKKANKQLLEYVDFIEKKLSNLLSRRFLSETDIKKIKKEISWAISNTSDNVSNQLNDILKDVINASGVETIKTKNNIANSIKNDYMSDVTSMMLSVGSEAEKAMQHLSYTINNQIRDDFQMLYNGLREWEDKDVYGHYKAFLETFQSDYGQKYMKELSENPLLDRMIKQEGDDFFFYHKNGKKYNLEKYLDNRAKWSTMDVIRKTEQARAQENGIVIFKFVRMQDVKEPREHSQYDNENEEAYFTTDENLVGKEFEGQTLLPANTISDFSIGAVAPFGCQHCYVGVDVNIPEDKEEEKEENIEENKNNLNNDENSSIINNEDVEEEMMYNKENLIKEIGENKKIEYKVDDEVKSFINDDNDKTKTKIVRIETDLLNNEIYFTDLNFNKHIEDNFGNKNLKEIQNKVIDSIKIPDFVLRDVKTGCIVYGKYFENELFTSSFIGEDSNRFFTVYERKNMFKEINNRYKYLYKK